MQLYKCKILSELINKHSTAMVLTAKHITKKFGQEFAFNTLYVERRMTQKQNAQLRTRTLKLKTKSFYFNWFIYLKTLSMSFRIKSVGGLI